jgi:hypothetical protein
MMHMTPSIQDIKDNTVTQTYSLKPEVIAQPEAIAGLLNGFHFGFSSEKELPNIR